MHARTSGRRRLGRSLSAVAATGAVVAALCITNAATATAAGPLPSTTTVAATGNWIAAGTPVNLTASTKVLGLPGLLVTPLGTVTFSVQGGPQLGAPVAIGGFTCLLKTCTATVNDVVTLPAGLDTVVATFSGDLLAGSSAGTTQIQVYGSSVDGSDSEHCATGVVCVADVPFVGTDAGTGSVSIQVTANGTTNSAGQTLSTAVIDNSDGQSCPGFDAIDTTVPYFIWNSTATDVSKTVVIDYHAAAADAVFPYGSGLGCYESTHPFKGLVFTPGGDGAYTYSNAPLVTNADGTYYQAPLFNCANTTPVNTAPCWTSSDYSGDGGSGTLVTLRIPPGDPKWLP